MHNHILSEYDAATKLYKTYTSKDLFTLKSCMSLVTSGIGLLRNAENIKIIELVQIM